MTYKRITVLIGLSIVCLGAALISAQNSPAAAGEEGTVLKAVEETCGGPGCRSGCSFAGNLSEDQKKKIDEAKAVLEKEMLPLKGKADVKAAELRSLLIADKPDAKAIDKKIEELNAVWLDMAKKKTQNHLKIREVLAPEQRVGFDQKVLDGFDPFQGPCGSFRAGHRPFMRRMMGPIGPGIRHPGFPEMMDRPIGHGIRIPEKGYHEKMKLKETKELQEEKK